MQKYLLALVLLLLASPAFSQSTAEQIELGLLSTSTTDCGTGPSPCFVPFSATNPMPTTGGGGGGGITFTDGTHTVSAATQLTVTGGVIGGSTPNATLSITGSGTSVALTATTSNVSYSLPLAATTTANPLANLYSVSGFTFNPSTTTFSVPANLNLSSGSLYEINGSQISCNNLSNATSACSTSIGTSGAVLPLLNGANTWSGVQTFGAGDIALTGTTTGVGIFNGTSVLSSVATLANSFLTNSSMTLAGHTVSLGGTQTFAASDLTNGVTGSGSIVLVTSPTLTTPTLGAMNFTSGFVTGGSLTTGSVLDLSAATNSVLLPIGTTGQRPTGVAGMLRYNTDISALELYASSLWNQEATLSQTQVFSASQRATLQTITISTATFTPNFDTGADFSITLVHASCPCTLANPSTTPVAGQHGIIYIIQSATGSDTITTWGSDYVIAGGTSGITLSTGANDIDVLSYAVKDSTHIVLSGPVLNVTH